MSYLFHLLITQPLFNGLVLLYKHVTFEDLGLAIIALTILIRFILYPLFYKGIKSQAVMQKLQPELKKIQEKHKGNREAQGKAMMEFYKEHKFNPFSSFFYPLIQLPILIAVYRLFLSGLTTESFAQLYSFVGAPATINNTFLGLIDVSQPNLIIVGVAVIVQYFQSKFSMPKRGSVDPNDKTAKMSQYMVYLAPLLMLLILPKLPAAVSLYLITAAVFSMIQQHYIYKDVYGHSPAKQHGITTGKN